MGLDKTAPSASMLAGGNGKTNTDVVATARGWERDLGNGQRELLHACTGLVDDNVAPGMSGVTFQRKRNLSIANGDEIIIKANFVEDVTVAAGTPQIDFTENGVAQVAAYVPGESSGNTLVFKYAVTTEGPIAGFGAGLSGGATIQDSDGNAVTQTFPAGFTAPDNMVVVA